MKRARVISSSPTRSSFRSIKSYTFVLNFWIVVVAAVVSGFTKCPISSMHRSKSVLVENNYGSKYRVGRDIRIGCNGMSRDDSMDLKSNSIGFIHHTAIKTRNITLAIQFYSLLGFEPAAKFKAGPAKAAWLEQKSLFSPRDASNSTSESSNSRIELIEVPPWILNEPEGMKRRAFDLFANQEYLGQNHLALDVTSSIDENKRMLELSPRNHTFLLSAWMDSLNEKSLLLFQKTLRVALEAEQFMVGNVVYERAFIYDADGALIELLYRAAELPQDIDPLSGWERYDWFEDRRGTVPDDQG